MVARPIFPRAKEREFENLHPVSLINQRVRNFPLYLWLLSPPFQLGVSLKSFLNIEPDILTNQCNVVRRWIRCG